MKRYLFIAVFVVSFFASGMPVCSAAEAGYTLVEATYTVQAQDTLQSIAVEYMAKNTYGEREVHEFMAGIRQLNEDLVTGTIHTGEVIRINYWVKK